MPARFKVYTRLEPQLEAALDAIGKEIRRKSARRRQREEHVARPSVTPYLRSKEDVEAAKQHAAAITADRDLPELPPPAPYKSAEDLLTERLEKVPLVDTSKAEQLSLLPLPA